MSPLIEERERRPVIFGLGADLSHREREALKERIALFAGIGLAIALALILLWGWYQDAVVTPGNQAAYNNKELALVGNQTIRMADFKSQEQFEFNNIQNSLTQIQQQLSSLQADTQHAKQNAALISQFQAEQSQLQQQQGTVSQGALTFLIDAAALRQRASTLGVHLSDAELNQQLLTQERKNGGVHTFEAVLAQSGMTLAQYRADLQANILETRVRAILAKKVGTYQTKVRASHILVKSKTLADQLAAKVEQGANFAALAKKYSKDTGSAVKGGDLGYFAKGLMVAPFDQAVFSMHVGQVRVVHTQYGWHVIKKTGVERVKMTSQEVSTAQDNAMASWLQQQEAILHTQRFLSPTALPTPVGASSAASTLPNGSTGQSVPSQQLPLPNQNTGQTGSQPKATSKKTTGKKSK